MQEQVYHVLEGEGLMEIDGRSHVVRKHDFIFLPPGVDHSIANTGLVDLVFLVVTSPVTDDVITTSTYPEQARRTLRAPSLDLDAASIGAPESIAASLPALATCRDRDGAR